MHSFENKATSMVACGKMLGHLWYLSEEMVALAFFDPLVPLDEKAAMVQALGKPGKKMF